MSEWQRYYAEEPWGFPMENVRFGTVATEVARPNYKAWGLPKPGDWFSPGKGSTGQSKDDMKGTMGRVVKQFDASRGK